jgi:hypothetical protein
MALTTYERSDEVMLRVGQILSDEGYFNGANSPFLGQIVQAIRGALVAEFDRLYSIANNVDLGRAEGEFLDRWGIFIDESRAIPSYAMDLSLSNTYLYIDPSIIAGDITSDGKGITIPAGSIISDEVGSYSVETIDEIYMSADRSVVYVRVVSATPGEMYIPAGALTTPELTMGEIENVLPSSLAEYTLKAMNTSEISGGVSLTDDETYRYILQEKAKSIGLFNESRVNTLLDTDEVIYLHIQEYTGGVNVYIGTKDPLLNEEIVEAARATMRNNRSMGTPVQVFGPITKRLKARLKVEVKDKDNLNETVSVVQSMISDYVTDLSMGETVDISIAITAVRTDVENIAGVRLLELTLDGRLAVSSMIGVGFNERTIMAEEDVTVT